ncbi:hypothetical protein ACIQOU_28465 [Streptomyces sp. NPDC091279]|uniref:hypothetical protein n=1 Tax=Streptomyces sp. NPDC091279 TaxID=3365983 RepID=UPI00382F3CAC
MRTPTFVLAAASAAVLLLATGGIATADDGSPSYPTEVHTGFGSFPDAGNVPTSGTTLSWSNANGGGNVSFFDGGTGF